MEDILRFAKIAAKKVVEEEKKKKKESEPVSTKNPIGGDIPWFAGLRPGLAGQGPGLRGLPRTMVQPQIRSTEEQELLARLILASLLRQNGL